MTPGSATPAEAVELMERVRARKLIALRRTTLPQDRPSPRKASQTQAAPSARTQD